MISVENLVKCFGPRHAVDGVSFAVDRGVVLGFLGPNGAGKSTTMRVITGYLTPTSGRVQVSGFDVAKDPVSARRHIGYLPENAPLYADMTVEGFLRFIAEMRGFSGAEREGRVDAALEKCLLTSVRRQTVDTLSKGYRQRTCFAQAILHDPPVLILDEPTEGLDPNQKHVVREMIRNMGRDKVIILSTHILEEVEAICSRVVIISRGKIVADSTPAELRRRSKTYQAVTLKLVAPAGEARAAFAGLGDVREVVVADAGGGSQSVRLFPRDGQPVTASALDLARSRQWLVMDVQTDDGRLDDVFRTLTTTDDVGRAAGKEA
jgi:ABC-2 type transport system ATP-binding protein